MTEKLALVPPLTEAPMTTLRQLVGEQASSESESLDAALRDTLGEQVQFLDVAELYALIPKWPAARVQGFGGNILIRYRGVETDLVEANNRGKRFASLSPINEMVAGFEVIDAETVVDDTDRYPGGVSSTLWSHRIGVSLDQPVRFRSLESGLHEARLFIPAVEPPELRLVNGRATVIQ